jgi:ribokinase
MKILNFGSLNVDYFYQVEHLVLPGETISSENLTITAGG